MKADQSPFVEDHFVDKSIVEEIYPTRDLHEAYIGKIAKTFVADDQGRMLSFAASTNARAAVERGELARVASAIVRCVGGSSGSVFT